MEREHERQLRRDFVRSSSIDQSLQMMREYDEDEPELLRPEDLDPEATWPTGRYARR